MWEVFVDVGNIHGSAFGPSMDMPKIAPAFSTYTDVGSVRGCREHPRIGIRSIHGRHKKARAISAGMSKRETTPTPGVWRRLALEWGRRRADSMQVALVPAVR